MFGKELNSDFKGISGVTSVLFPEVNYTKASWQMCSQTYINMHLELRNVAVLCVLISKNIMLHVFVLVLRIGFV